MLHLYAITDAAPRLPLPGVRGLDDAPLEQVVERGIAGVCTHHLSPIAASEEALWRHEHVVEALMANRTVLPVRFGTSVADAGDLRRALRDRHAAFREALAYVRGRVELGLRVLWTPDESGNTAEDPDRGGKSGPGKAYLEARLAEQKRVRELADAVHDPLAAVAVASRHRVVASARLLLTGAYLVEHDRVTAFSETLEGVRAAHPALSVLCTGPWPPYNFVEDPRATA